MADDGVDISAHRVVFDGVFRLEETTLRYRRFDGELSDEVRRLSLERGNSAAVLLLDTTTSEVVLVEQFKWPTHRADGGWIVETLSGVVDDGESPEEAARREALEETGYELTDLHLIARFYTSPGGSSEQVYLYYAEVDDAARRGAGGGVAGEAEDIRLRRYAVAEVGKAVDEGEIVDAKTIIAIDWIRRRRAEQR
jgi:nudix-type nucleoside diphosphatase (YffH/AdpP family)